MTPSTAVVPAKATLCCDATVPPFWAAMPASARSRNASMGIGREAKVRERDPQHLIVGLVQVDDDQVGPPTRARSRFLTLRGSPMKSAVKNASGAWKVVTADDEGVAEADGLAPGAASRSLGPLLLCEEHDRVSPTAMVAARQRLAVRTVREDTRQARRAGCIVLLMERHRRWVPFEGRCRSHPSRSSTQQAIASNSVGTGRDAAELAAALARARSVRVVAGSSFDSRRRKQNSVLAVEQSQPEVARLVAGLAIDEDGERSDWMTMGGPTAAFHDDAAGRGKAACGGDLHWTGPHPQPSPQW